MTPSWTWRSSFRATLLVSLSGAAALALRRAGDVSDVRPAVALRFQVEGRDYGVRLKDDTGVLRTTTGDTVRTLLERHFAFLNCDAPLEAPAETVVARLYQ